MYGMFAMRVLHYFLARYKNTTKRPLSPYTLELHEASMERKLTS